MKKENVLLFLYLSISFYRGFNIRIRESFARNEQNLGERSATSEPIKTCYMTRAKQSEARVQRGERLKRSEEFLTL